MLRTGSDAQKVGDNYASFMDEAGIESKGITPLQPMFAKTSPSVRSKRFSALRPAYRICIKFAFDPPNKSQPRLHHS
jgi:putative endopeptidase